jgi:hypothetical protein
MRFRLFPFGRDLRSKDLQQRYETIEKKRADVWLSIALARKRAVILRGQINTPYLAQPQVE